MAQENATLSVNQLADLYDRKQAKALNATLTLDGYMKEVEGDPGLVRTAYQRLYDMIMEAGTETVTRYRKKITKYNFFVHDRCPVYGLEETLHNLVQAFRGAAYGFGTERRLVLLRGPVGSSKSTICKALKLGLEKYTATEAGRIYTYSWKNLDVVPGLYAQETCASATHDDPIRLVPKEIRENVVTPRLNAILQDRYEKAVAKAKLAGGDGRDVPRPRKVNIMGDLNPRCQFILDRLMEHYDYDWQKVMDNHVVVHRFAFDEKKRLGIATFQPKDEKNQDATELTGDANYQLLATYGTDSDPRAFSYDGEFHAAHRGFFEFIEILKLAKEFLYDVLGATQERQVKPKKFAQCDIDEVLLGHTNNPEHERVLNDRTMEALRDRTILIDVPYLKEWSKELLVLEKDYGPDKVTQHIAPHTLEIAALWAVMTRLVDDKDHKLALGEKAELYDGRALPGYTEDNVKELMDKYPEEGLSHGMSARFVQNKISNSLVANERYINAFMVLNELEGGLNNCSSITNEDHRAHYRKCIVEAKRKYDEIVKQEVQEACIGDGNAIVRLCSKYVDNVFAHIKGSKIRDPFTGKDVEPDERLMRSIETKIDIHEQAADDFRRSIAGFVGDLANTNQKFTWESNARLKKALKAKLFEDTKDLIKIAKHGVGGEVVDPEQQAKIDVIIDRLCKQKGYIPESAKDVLDYVSSIFARGQGAEDEG